MAPVFLRVGREVVMNQYSLGPKEGRRRRYERRNFEFTLRKRNKKGVREERTGAN